ncbi:MAG: hypothetical protein QF535_01860 [Anaerolineales bacterium]|nr:hypothetical protein [Anaerolineales bacterium]
MANTFKLKTKSGVNGAALSTVYTVPANTTAVIIGLTISNIKGQSITADAQIVTASSTGENADDVYIVKDVPLPAGSSIEVMSGNKIILQAGDVVKSGGSNASGNDADVILSIMEIT